MKLIDKLIVKSFLGPFVMTFFIAEFILLMQFLWKYIDDLVGKGLEWYIIIKLLFYSSATFVPLALPLAMLLSSLMTFGNLGENYELAALKSSGISLKRIMAPMIVLSIFISSIAFYFSNYILPIANLKSLSLLWDVREHKPALNIKEGIFYYGIEGFVIRVGTKENDNKTIHDVIIYDHTGRSNGNTNITQAKSGLMEVTDDKKYLIFTLYNGFNYEENIENRADKISRPFQRTKFKEQFRKFDLSSFSFKKTNEDLFKKNYQMLNLKQLSHNEDSIRRALAKKRNDFSKSIFHNFYFYSKIDSSETLDTDTFPALKKSFISNFEKDQQKSIMELALRTTRNIKDNIGFHITEFGVHSSRVYKHQIEWHKKFTLSIACLLMFFIGAPLGAIIRKGGLGVPVVVSVLFFVIFWVISISSEKSAKEGVIEPIIAMWISSSFLLPIGLFFTYKATTDSPLMDSDGWKKFFYKFRFTRKKNIASDENS